MARRLSIAFGLNSNTADMEYVSNATNPPTISNFPGIGAVKSARISSMISAQSSGFNISHGALDYTAFEFLLRVHTLPSAANTILRMSGAAVFVRVKLNSTGTLELSDEDSVIGTSAGALSVDTDYRIGIIFDRTAAGGSHIVGLYVNGAQVVNATNRDISATPNVLEFGGNRNLESQTQGDWYITNIRINDNTLGVQTGLPGAGFLAYARAAANGDANSGAARGGTDTGADWSQLSEVTPDDGGTYIELSTTSGVVWVKVTDPAVLGIQGAYIINLVQVGGRIALASAGAGNWFPSIKSQAGGAVLDGAAVTLALATYATNDDSAGLKQYKLTSYTDPQTGGAWTAAKLATMQIGGKTSDGSPATRISNLWAVIDYVPYFVTIPTVLEGGVDGGLQVLSGGFR